MFLHKLLTRLANESHIVSSDDDRQTRPLCLEFHIENVNCELDHVFTQQQLDAIHEFLVTFVTCLPDESYPPPDIDIPCNNLRLRLIREPTEFRTFLNKL